MGSDDISSVVEHVFSVHKDPVLIPSVKKWGKNGRKK
jgi:hypothetical protein